MPAGLWLLAIKVEATAVLEVVRIFSTTAQSCSHIVFLTDSMSVTQGLLSPKERLERDIANAVRALVGKDGLDPVYPVVLWSFEERRG